MHTDTPTILPAGTWHIDPAHTTVEFAVKHLGFATVKGRAAEVTGSITGGAEPRFEAVIPVTGLTTFEAARDRHLQTPDFFDAANHPEIRFAGAGLTTGDDGRLGIDGTLTMRGVSRPVRLAVTITSSFTDLWGDERIGLDAEADIDRRDFGVSWNEVLRGGDLLVSNTVRLAASVSAVLGD